MKTFLPEPSDSDLRRLHDQLSAGGVPPNPVEFARKVLHRWGVIVCWLPHEEDAPP